MASAEQTARTRSSGRGFTLVEVIVVAVIVAVLALVSILLYMGYVRDARLQVIENVASSAASYLNSARNLDVQVPGPGIGATLDENGQWVLTTPGGNGCVFRCPKGTVVEIQAAGRTVTARYVQHGVVSSPYKFEN